MKTIFLFILFALPAHAIDTGRMLAALAGVETASRDVRGRAGEATPWQLTAATWRRYSSAPHGDPRVARTVAELHVRQCAAELRQRGVRVTPEAIARKWNPRAPRDYVERIGNLYRATR